MGEGGWDNMGGAGGQLRQGESFFKWLCRHAFTLQSEQRCAPLCKLAACGIWPLMICLMQASAKKTKSVGRERLTTVALLSGACMLKTGVSGKPMLLCRENHSVCTAQWTGCLLHALAGCGTRISTHRVNGRSAGKRQVWAGLAARRPAGC